MKMKFSVITPALRLDNYLDEAILSVKNQIQRLQNQDYYIQHIIVLDDECLDVPDDVISGYYELKYYKLNGYKNGPSIARNFGIIKADGDVICFIDADDIWLNSYLYLLHQKYTDLGVSFVAGNGIKYINNKISGSLAQPFISSRKIKNELLWNAIGCPSGFSYRVNDESKLIRFDTRLFLFEDWHFYLRIFSAMKIGAYGFHLGEPTYLYRISPTQSTSKKTLTNKKFESSIDVFLSFTEVYTYLESCILKLQAKRLYKKIYHRNTLVESLLIYLLQPRYLFAQFRRVIKRVK